MTRAFRHQPTGKGNSSFRTWIGLFLLFSWCLCVEQGQEEPGKLPLESTLFHSNSPKMHQSLQRVSWITTLFGLTSCPQLPSSCICGQPSNKNPRCPAQSEDMSIPRRSKVKQTQAGWLSWAHCAKTTLASGSGFLNGWDGVVADRGVTTGCCASQAGVDMEGVSGRLAACRWNKTI